MYEQIKEEEEEERILVNMFKCCFYGVFAYKWKMIIKIKKTNESQSKTEAICIYVCTCIQKNLNLFLKSVLSSKIFVKIAHKYLCAEDFDSFKSIDSRGSKEKYIFEILK